MPNFCANLDYLFRSGSMDERFARAKAAGFSAVEFVFPYDSNAAEIVAASQRHDLPVCAISAPPPNHTGGPRGFAAMPERRARFQTDFQRAVRFAKVLGAGQINIISGRAEGPAAEACLIENLAWALDAAPRFALTIEPKGVGDFPGYFLSDFALAARVIEAVGSSRLGLQFDFHHAAQIEGDVLGSWTRYHEKIAHIQLCGLQNRAAPGECSFDFALFCEAVDHSAFGGYVSAEYTPPTKTEDSLGWMGGLMPAVC